ncbi:complement C1q tumor necrosis factor-related protein 3-like [Siniperca chuatsi]|uniref:complement C1q tumor necrosis factor-related protein 3-like n=1 Tax=Siniperca chuatsi TaxID=119488 RepID=UPI001CE17D76|nr:complement C1q tumor necrosis factor-related protein 3-like [Siniperca chuatsi]
MVSGWFLMVLVVCGLVGLQSAAEGDEDQRGLLQQLMARVEKLEEDRGKSQVAFSASLVSTVQWTDHGPFDTNTTLVFQRVKTNIGNAYDKETGIFTAPVKGLYYIRFTGCVGKSGKLNAAVMKNGVNVFAIYNVPATRGTTSNGMTLALEEGDRLWVELWANTSISDQSRLSTFSGFLVFPL